MKSLWSIRWTAAVRFGFNVAACLITDRRELFTPHQCFLDFVDLQVFSTSEPVFSLFKTISWWCGKMERNHYTLILMMSEFQLSNSQTVTTHETAFTAIACCKPTHWSMITEWQAVAYRRMHCHLFTISSGLLLLLSQFIDFLCDPV